MNARYSAAPGDRFGKLSVVNGLAVAGPGGHRFVDCVCECGGRASVAIDKLFKGHTRSCGCLHNEILVARSVTHGNAARQNRSGAYNSWAAMIDRCYRPTSTSWSRYGAVGITVCDRWRRSFDLFLSDMGDRPVGKTLDRKDGRGNYQPGNCRWATPREQAANRRPPKKRSQSHLYEDRGVKVLATFDERRELGPNAIHSTDCPCRTGKETKS